MVNAKTDELAFHLKDLKRKIDYWMKKKQLKLLYLYIRFSSDNKKGNTPKATKGSYKIDHHFLLYF